MEARFHRFACALPGAERVDDVLGDRDLGQRADYLWRGRSVIVELKLLAADPQKKVDAIVDSLRSRPDFPLIFGQVPIDGVLAELSDGEEQRRKLRLKVHRSIEGAFRSAKHQIKNTQRLLGVDDALGILVMLNPCIDALSPRGAGQVLSRLLVDHAAEGGAIDAVWFLSEAHLIQGSLPCLMLEGKDVDRFPWGSKFLEGLTSAWARFNNAPALKRRAVQLTDLEVSIPMTSVTVHTGDMGDSFAAKGLAALSIRKRSGNAILAREI